MSLRIRLALVAVAGVTALGVALGPVVGFGATVPAALTVAALLGVLVSGPVVYRWIPAVVAAVAINSIGFTLFYRGRFDIPANLVSLIEVAGMIWLIILLVRHAPVRLAWPVGVLAAVAESTQILRSMEASVGSFELVAGIAFWSLGSICAVLGGLYLRALDTRRRDAVETARKTQRLDLARDLHDFVAHDVSGIVVQAQAAQVVADRDPAAVLAALRRIEEAGLQALAAMDRTVHMLRSSETPRPGGAERAPVQGVTNLPEVVERFAVSGSASARLQLDPDFAERLTREVSATVYRVVVEALTNVRRHAPAARLVEVVVRPDGDGVEATVTNDSGSDGGGAPTTDLASAGRQGGLGLLGLTERVEALGGWLDAGAHGVSGWQVRAHLPLPPPQDGPAGQDKPAAQDRSGRPAAQGREGS